MMLDETGSTGGGTGASTGRKSRKVLIHFNRKRHGHLYVKRSVGGISAALHGFTFSDFAASTFAR
ncbi:hypothetical protein [Methylobacterium sp. SD21]|uniref:hypothetical protein n=1 Tax=Methylobacterium litchii TaxID=3138810 RepID=UPI00313CC8C5